MRVLLLNPPGPYVRAGSRWPHRRPQEDVGIDYHPFPFWLAYAASTLRDAGYEVELRDCVALHWSMDELEQSIEGFAPEVVVIETSAPSYAYDVWVRRQLSQPCVAVGFHASATYERHLEDGFAAVVVGEYDLALRACLDAWQGHGEMPEYVAQPGGPPQVPHAPLIRNLDRLPHPAWDLLPMTSYNDAICKGSQVTVMSTRGCPVDCSFCYIGGYFGKPNYRLRQASAVCDEIEEVQRRYQPDEIYFDDDNITVSKKHVAALCNEMLARGMNLRWTCMGDATADAETLELMARAGCRAFKFGVESADDEVLANVNKHVRADDVRRLVGDCKRLGIKTHATYVFGLPGETLERARKTIDFALEISTDTLQFSVATPYPGTALYRQSEANGWLTSSDWANFDGAGVAVLSYENYPAADIEAVFEEAWNRWHRHLLRRQPPTILHHLANAWRRGGVRETTKLMRYGGSKLRGALR